MNFIQKNIKTLIILIMILFPICLMAQGDPPDDPSDVPIDGGLSILLAAGAAYGVKKVKDNIKKD